MGIAKSTFIVAESEPRKSQQTPAVRMTASTSSSAISFTDSSMKPVVSKRTSTFIPSGSVFWTSSSALRTSLATPTAFDPGCFKMPIACTGTPSRGRGRARDRRDVLEAVLDERDVAELHLGGADLANDDVSERVEIRGLAEHAHVERALAVRHLTAG